MSWYLANEDGMIDQFASGKGLEDLTDAVKSGYPAVKDFLTVGATHNIILCQMQLDHLAAKSHDESIKDTANGLAALLHGQKLVWITQGFSGSKGKAKVKESASAPPDEKRSLRHPDHARRLNPIRKRVRQIVSGYFRRQKAAILDDVRLRFWSHEMPVREADAADDQRAAAEKRAVELLPDALSPLNFAITTAEDSDYAAAIARAIVQAQEQLQSEIGTGETIAESAMSRYIREHSLSKLTGQLSDFTKTRLRNAIADSIESGGTAEDIVDAIKTTMDDFTTRRAKLVAQQEINTAYNWARHELADTAGMNEKMWQTESVAPCPICVLNMAQNWIPIEDDFISGDVMPPGHVGCYCTGSYRLISSGEGSGEGLRLVEYDPGQPRDDHGRWTATGHASISLMQHGFVQSKKNPDVWRKGVDSVFPARSSMAVHVNANNTGVIHGVGLHSEKVDFHSITDLHNKLGKIEPELHEDLNHLASLYRAGASSREVRAEVGRLRNKTWEVSPGAKPWEAGPDYSRNFRSMETAERMYRTMNKSG